VSLAVVPLAHALAVRLHLAGPCDQRAHLVPCMLRLVIATEGCVHGIGVETVDELLLLSLPSALLSIPLKLRELLMLIFQLLEPASDVSLLFTNARQLPLPQPLRMVSRCASRSKPQRRCE